jgi:drug/metabolite transporter (DMT)-like permease
MEINSKYLGILCITLAQVIFTTLDMVFKFLSGDYALFQITLISAIVAIIFTLIVLVRIDGGFKYLRTQRLGLHLLRGFGIVVAHLCFLTALVTIPLAETKAIFFIAPLLITSLSVLLIGEKVGMRSWIAVFVGFLGVMVLFRPDLGVFNAVYMLPLAAALAYSLVQIATRIMGEAEKASTMAFYIQLNFVFFSSLMGLIFGDGNLADPSQPIIFYLFRAWIVPTWQDLMIMLGIGLFGGLGVYFVSNAYRISKAGVIAPFEYVALPLSIFWSITIFGDWPDIVSWLGIVLIAGAGLYVVYSETIQGRKNDIYRPIPRNR